MTDNTVANGKFVAQHLYVEEDVTLWDTVDARTRIQPNGVDLTLDEVYRTQGRAEFSESGYMKPDRIRMEPKADEKYRLYPGVYPIVYGDRIEIPEGYVGRVYPRSRLMRSGLHLTSALWDQGYEGIGEGLLQIPPSVREVTIPQGLPIAQMSFLTADSQATYDGTHQQERLSVEGDD